MTTRMPKVVLITGAARRIGAATARLLHQENMNIVLHFNTSKTDAKKLCDELNQTRKNSAVIVQGDLSQTKNLSKIMKEATQAWGRLDALVNNASQFIKNKIDTVRESDWDYLLNTNLKAPFFLSQAALPQLKKNQGCIVNITDIHAERPLSGYCIYSVSKAGLLMLTKSLAKELGPTVRVNAVAPGPILWPEGKNKLSAKIKKEILDRTVLKREGNAQEIAKAVLFFVKEANYVTGQVLAIDGGRSLFV